MTLRTKVKGWGGCATVLLSFAAAAARAGFTDGLAGAAAEGAGGAYVAKADEAGALFANAAGLSQLNQGEASFLYGKPLAGIPGLSLQQGAAALALPAGRVFTFAAGAGYFDNAGLSKEYEALVGGSMRLGGIMSAGAAAGYLRRDYDVGRIPGASGDPVFKQGTSKGAVGLDAGVLVKPSRLLSLGASARNINRPDLGLAAADKVPMTWRAGGALRWQSFTFLGEARGRSDNASGASKWGAGVEWRAVPPLVLRAGADDGQVNAGMGLSFRDIRLDYAFSFVQGAGSSMGGSHQVSMGYRFGALRSDGGEAPVKAAPKSRAPRKRAPVARAPAASLTQDGDGGGVSTRDTRAYPTATRETPASRRRMRPIQ